MRKILGKGRPEPTLAYVQDDALKSEEWQGKPHPSVATTLREMDDEIDLSRRSDLEGYAKDINVSRESIERWISSGLLMPEELKMAEKLVQLMRKH